MQDHKTVAAYLASNYPYPHELSESRLVKMMYLADWRAAIIHGERLTDIEWIFNHYGPYTSQATSDIIDRNGFRVRESQNYYGSNKRIFEYVGDKAILESLQPWQIEVIDFVITETKHLSYSAFMKLVYGTYPIVVSDRYSTLDLVCLAEHYREARSQTGWGVPEKTVPTNDGVAV